MGFGRNDSRVLVASLGSLAVELADTREACPVYTGEAHPRYTVEVCPKEADLAVQAS